MGINPVNVAVCYQQSFVCLRFKFCILEGKSFHIWLQRPSYHDSWLCFPVTTRRVCCWLYLFPVKNSQTQEPNKHRLKGSTIPSCTKQLETCVYSDTSSLWRDISRRVVSNKNSKGGAKIWILFWSGKNNILRKEAPSKWTFVSNTRKWKWKSGNDVQSHLNFWKI